MSDPDPVKSPERDIIDKKIRRAVGINALRKIGGIVAEDIQADNNKAKILRWFLRFGWIVLTAGGLLLLYAIGFI